MPLTKASRWLVIAVATASLLGCAAHSLDSSVAKNTHRIALLGPSGSEKYTIKSLAPAQAGIFLGLAGYVVGKVIEDAVVSDPERQLDSLLKQRNLHITQDVADATEAALRERGYEVVRVSVPRADAADELDVKSDLAPGSDIMVDITLVGGYSDTAVNGDWGPLIFSLVRAYDSRTQTVLFTTRTGCVIKGATPATQRFAFQSLSDMLARPDDAVDGLRACTKLLGPAIAKLFAS
jgi:hypothetical protein